MNAKEKRVVRETISRRLAEAGIDPAEFAYNCVGIYPEAFAEMLTGEKEISGFYFSKICRGLCLGLSDFEIPNERITGRGWVSYPNLRKAARSHGMHLWDVLDLAGVTGDEEQVAFIGCEKKLTDEQEAVIQRAVAPERSIKWLFCQ